MLVSLVIRKSKAIVLGMVTKHNQVKNGETARFIRKGTNFITRLSFFAYYIVKVLNLKFVYHVKMTLMTPHGTL